MVVITYHSTHVVNRTAQAFCVPPTVDTMKPRSVSEYLVRAMEDKEKWDGGMGAHMGHGKGRGYGMG